MAKQMPWTDPSGATHAESVWLPTFVAFDHARRAGRVEFHGWHDLAALAAGRPPVPGAVRAYAVAGADYLALAGTAVPAGSDTLLAAVAAAAYAALADPDEFFAAAQDVTLPG